MHKLNEYMTCATIVQNSDPWQIANGNLELHQDVASKLLLYASSEEHAAAVNLVDTYSPRQQDEKSAAAKFRDQYLDAIQSSDKLAPLAQHLDNHKSLLIVRRRSSEAQTENLTPQLQSKINQCQKKLTSLLTSISVSTQKSTRIVGAINKVSYYAYSQSGNFSSKILALDQERN